MQKLIHERTSVNKFYLVERNDMALRQEENIKRLIQIHVNDMDRISQELFSSKKKLCYKKGKKTIKD